MVGSRAPCSPAFCAGMPDPAAWKKAYDELKRRFGQQKYYFIHELVELKEKFKEMLD